jgi:hypothetical protein
MYLRSSSVLLLLSQSLPYNTGRIKNLSVLIIRKKVYVQSHPLEFFWTKLTKDFAQPSQFGNYTYNKFYEPHYLNIASTPHLSQQEDIVDQFVKIKWKISILRELREIKSTLIAILIQGRQLR